MIPEMSVARSEFAKRITDTYHRSAVKHISGHSLVLHPAAVNDSIFVFPAKPVMAS
jgi:hypothetical protein